MKRGFTLIELLVVIAIIGVLSSVVLASLNTARNKGNDAAIKSNLDNLRAQGALYYDENNGTYSAGAVTSCTPGSNDNLFDDATAAAQIAAADTANGAASSLTCNIAADGSAYAVASPLVTDTSTFFCVDSTGVAATTTTALGTDTVCP